MKIKIYGDASSGANGGVSCSLIMTNTHFIDYIAEEYDIEGSEALEIMAVNQGLKYIIDNGIPFSSIECYIDFLNIKYAFHHREYANQNEYYREMIELCKKIGFNNISMIHLKGHQNCNNPNKICDQLASLIRIGLNVGETKHLIKPNRDLKLRCE